MYAAIKKLFVALIVVTTLGSSARASWGMGFPAIPPAPTALELAGLGAVVGVVFVAWAISKAVSAVGSCAADSDQADAGEASTEPATPLTYDVDCAKGEAGEDGCRRSASS